MSTRRIHIKKARQDDAPLLSDLIRESFRDVAQRFELTPENCPKHPSNCTTEWIERSLIRGAAYYLLEHGGRPVGCFSLKPVNPELCYLERLAVLPRYRRNGFGKAMMDHAFSEARQFGTTQIRIGIISDDVELKKWYQKMGFCINETKAFSFLPFTVTFMFYPL